MSRKTSRACSVNPSGISPLNPDQNTASSSPEIGRLRVYVEVTLLSTILEICFRSTKRRGLGCTAGKSSRNGWHGWTSRDVTKIGVALLGSQRATRNPLLLTSNKSGKWKKFG